MIYRKYISTTARTWNRSRVPQRATYIYMHNKLHTISWYGRSDSRLILSYYYSHCITPGPVTIHMYICMYLLPSVNINIYIISLQTRLKDHVNMISLFISEIAIGSRINLESIHILFYYIKLNIYNNMMKWTIILISIIISRVA